ncbi:LytR C-terminal domain-containing protein [Massilia sp. CF038]|uniref:LytR C-terminal domain-containing protein n=1 Tax=Massilia sp. CF038 TaxID=1881045 RepID=UPI0009225133|nr:LytR C-terminal domain-containing protein [Massilia sp. CF038]SHG50294.1 Tetratricopeptide repeat-containing protein [Massilia sp. CF038]
MPAPRFIHCCIAGAVLLQGCATTSNPVQHLRVQPHYQVNHSTNETAEAYYQLARIHQGQGNLDLALAGYTYAIARDPGHVEARSAAAAIHARQGRLEQARAMMLEVVTQYPALSQAHNNLGYIEYLRGDHASAVAQMRQAVALDGGNERARNNLRLAEAAMAHATPPQLAQAVPEPESAPAPAPEPAPGRMALVQVIPQVYELKLASSTTATAVNPVVAATLTARVEVSNGAGTPGLARRVGALLGKQGVQVARLTNQRPFGQQSTRIVFRPELAAQAQALRKLIDGPVEMAPSVQLAGASELRVVLGRDTQHALALRDAAPVTTEVALR